MVTSETTNLHLVKPDYTEIGDVDVINDNMDIIDGAVGNINTSLGGKKTTQTAKSDPTASGTSLTFIDTVTQNANGEVTATKKTVKDMTGATASAAGAHGLVPQPAAGNNGKYLRGDGTWQTPPNTTYGAATSSSLGLIKTGYTASGKYYPVLLDGNNNAYVNVPWTDTNTTYSEATSSTYGLIKTGYTASGKNYPVQLSSGKAYVNVPWTDTNTWRGYKVQAYVKYSVTIEGNSFVVLTANDMGFISFSGYTPVAITSFDASSIYAYVYLVNAKATGTQAAINIKNMSSSSITMSVTMTILYLQT